MILMAGILIYNIKLRQTRRVELIYLRNLIISEIVLIIVNAIETYAYSKGVANNPGMEEAILFGIPNIVTIVVLLQWLFCVDISMTGSLDRARRRYRRMKYIPVVIEIVLIIVTGILAEDIDIRNVSDPEEVIPIILWLIFRFIFEVSFDIYCLLKARRIVKYRENELKQSSFIRFSWFMIPAIVGYFFDTFSLYELLPLGLAISIVATYMSMRLFIEILDEETGFYDEDFFKYAVLLSQKRKKRKIGDFENASAIYLESDGDALELAEVIKAFRPEKSTVVRNMGRTFIIIADIADPTGIEFMIDTVKEALAQVNPGAHLESSYRIKDKNVSFDAFIRSLNS